MTGENLLWYLGGFIDGDGSILITRTRKGEKLSFHVNLQVSNTRKEILELLKDTFDKGKVVSYRMNKKDTKISCYQWSVAGKTCLPILQKIVPYLFIKKKNAELVIEYCNTIGPVYGTHYRVPQDIIEKREDIFRRFQELPSARSTKRKKVTDGLVN